MKIFIDQGHGGSDPGAVSKIKESEFTLSYGYELGRVLMVLGFEVMYSRTSDYAVSLAERCRMANTWGADYFISIHFNSGGGIGIETFALSAGGQGEKLAKAVQGPIIDATGAVNRGVKFANFQVLRDTSMPAILIEGGFVDSDIDAQKIKTEDYKRKFIQGATKGICAFTGVNWNDPYAVIVQPPSIVEDKDIYLSVRVLQSKADQAIKDINKLGFAAKKLDLA
ncbi:N-acetylmuramoyl-L-alanine amidase family protein [Desulfosporosinus hippei]|uniref:N-acetylmuramoyl-L-alanine amidase n=1 Tax=Desulfosporosinus hippei DSM 8344 TaxID=1121419 RepID=A0A1G7UJ56_9FIRM|nr:N-acetylmuramoyl-L-alanine amidase [Desulfosporosinus hippei]SDG47109.1 N-acetylmuramoyl-L-alanine amidase [Desulfosporosinus hippei DSM 8344]